MKEIKEKWLEWKEGKDDGYIYDEGHEFFNSLSRAELLEILGYIEEFKS